MIILLDRLIDLLKDSDYPIIELVDIISIRIMLEHIVSNPILLANCSDFIKKSIEIINEILGESVYVKIDMKLIALEDEFYRNIAIDKKRFEHKITEEIRQLTISK